MLIDLSLLRKPGGEDGFIFTGQAPGDLSGNQVSGAGDVNGDGIDDLLIGAAGANGSTGEAYLVYGGEEVLDLFDKADSTIDGTIDLNNIGLDPLLVV